MIKKRKCLKKESFKLFKKLKVLRSAEIRQVNLYKKVFSIFNEGLNNYIYNKITAIHLRKCRYNIGSLPKSFIFDLYLFNMLLLGAKRNL